LFWLIRGHYITKSNYLANFIHLHKKIYLGGRTLSDQEFAIGDIVTGIYKTGKYIGEITAIKEEHYLVKIKSVLRHPLQGDIHTPKQVDVPIFHERRALACNEQANIPQKMVHRYEGKIKDYHESLGEALSSMKKDLEAENSEWSKRCLQNIASLEKDYFG